MSKRHWLRDVIDFSERPHASRSVIGSWRVAPSEDCASTCAVCNRAAQEISDSLALDGCASIDGGAADYLAWDADERDAEARVSSHA